MGVEKNFSTSSSRSKKKYGRASLVASFDPTVVLPTHPIPTRKIFTVPSGKPPFYRQILSRTGITGHPGFTKSPPIFLPISLIHEWYFYNPKDTSKP
jgi:hypothetical protein